jgi:hypothetical protein
MTAKEWLQIMEQAADYNPAMTPLIEKYGEMLIAERMPTDEEIEQVALNSFHKATYYQAVKDAINWFRSHMEDKK